MNKKQLFFDNLACVWEELFYKDKEIIERLDKQILRWPIKNKDVILDLGCGTGILEDRILKIKKDVIIFGCDFSYSMLRILKEKRNIFSVCGCAQTLPFKNNLFDVVICFSSFPHFDDKKKTIEEIKRVLKKDGFFIISHLLSSQQIVEVHKDKEVVSSDSIPSEKWMRKELERVGFKLIEFEDREGIYYLLCRSL